MTSFSSARGAILELIKANIEIPPGVLIFEDPPIHDLHRDTRQHLACSAARTTARARRWRGWETLPAFVR